MTDVITKKTTGEIKNREAALRRQCDPQSRVWRSPPAHQGSGLEARDSSRHRRVLPAQFSRGGRQLRTTAGRTHRYGTKLLEKCRAEAAQQGVPVETMLVESHGERAAT